MPKVEYIMTPNGSHLEVIEVDADAYAKRVLALENEGMTTSDAQGVADVEFLKEAGVWKS